MKNTMKHDLDNKIQARTVEQLEATIKKMKEHEQEMKLFRQQCYLTAFIGTFIIILTILQLASL